MITIIPMSVFTFPEWEPPEPVLRGYRGCGQCLLPGHHVRAAVRADQLRPLYQPCLQVGRRYNLSIHVEDT